MRVVQGDTGVRASSRAFAQAGRGRKRAARRRRGCVGRSRWRSSARKSRNGPVNSQGRCRAVSARAKRSRSSRTARYSTKTALRRRPRHAVAAQLHLPEDAGPTAQSQQRRCQEVVPLAARRRRECRAIPESTSAEQFSLLPAACNSAFGRSPPAFGRPAVRRYKAANAVRNPSSRRGSSQRASP